MAARLLPELERCGSVAALRAAGVPVVGLAWTADDAGALVDLDGTYRRWFAELGCVAVAVRPDFYVYGTAADLDCTRTLAKELLGALGAELAVAGRN